MDDIPELKSKADQGDADAQHALGKIYLDKYQVSGDCEQEEIAQQWFERAAEKGHREAQFCLAEIIFWHEPQNGWEWYQAAADQGHPQACMRLSYRNLEYGGTEKEAVKWYRRARELGHSHDAWGLNIAPPQRDKPPVPTGEKMKKSAETGNPQSQYELGRAYAHGEAGSVDFVQAYAWCAVSANHVPGTPLEEPNEQLRSTSPTNARGIIRLLEEVFDEDERSQAHTLATQYMRKFGRGE